MARGILNGAREGKSQGGQRRCNIPGVLRLDLSRLSVPEDRHGHQKCRDDPKNDIFRGIFLFLFSHKCSTAYMKPCFKSRREFVSQHCFTVLIPLSGMAAVCSL